MLLTPGGVCTEKASILEHKAMLVQLVSITNIN